MGRGVSTGTQTAIDPAMSSATRTVLSTMSDPLCAEGCPRVDFCSLAVAVLCLLSIVVVVRAWLVSGVCALLFIVVCCCPMLSRVDQCCPLWFSVIACPPLPPVVQCCECCPVFSADVQCCTLLLSVKCTGKLLLTEFQPFRCNLTCFNLWATGYTSRFF